MGDDLFGGNANIGNSLLTVGTAAHLSLAMVHGGYLRAALAAAGAPNASAAHLRAALVQMPPVAWIPGVGVAPPNPYQTLIWPLFTMFTLPGIVLAVAMERQEKLWALMSMSGLRRAPYLAAHWAAGVLAFLPVGAAYVLIGWLAGSASFVLPSPLLFAALLAAWAHAQAGWGILLGSLIPAPRAASILCYLLAVGVALANLIITSAYSPWPRALTWVPFLSYARASTLVLTASGLPSGARGAQVWEAIGITFLQGTLALALGAYLHAVLPGPEQAGVTLHPLFPLHAVQEWLGRGGGGGQQQRQGSLWQWQPAALLLSSQCAALPRHGCGCGCGARGGDGRGRTQRHKDREWAGQQQQCQWQRQWQRLWRPCHSDLWAAEALPCPSRGPPEGPAAAPPPAHPQARCQWREPVRALWGDPGAAGPQWRWQDHHHLCPHWRSARQCRAGLHWGPQRGH